MGKFFLYGFYWLCIYGFVLSLGALITGFIKEDEENAKK